LILSTENNNYDVSEIININDEENILQILFAKAQLSPIHHCELVHHIQVNPHFLIYTNKLNLICLREMKNFLNLIY
jgi:hypothetical protein